MALRKRNELVNIDEIYVASATYILDCDSKIEDASCIRMFFLVKKQGNEFFEFFSNCQLDKKENTHQKDMIVAYFKTIYVEDVKPLSEYINDKND